MNREHMTVVQTKGLKFLCALLPSVICISAATSRINAQPALSNVVLFGTQSISELDTADYAESEKQCLKNFLEKIPADSPLRIWKQPADMEKVIEARRKNFEILIVTLSGETSQSAAAEFAHAVPLGLEWEGLWEGPLGEADFTLQWLEQVGETEIAPFLHLFMAHRLRAAYEAAVNEGGNKGLIPILVARYKEQITFALSSSNTLIACIAKDLEEQPYVYLSQVGRP